MGTVRRAVTRVGRGARTSATSLVVLAAAAALAAPGVPAAAARTPAPAAIVAPDPVRVLLVGDSVTQGSAGDWTWRYRLWQHLEAAGVAVDFVGPREDLYDNVTDTQGSLDYVEPDFDRDHAARWGQSLEVQDVAIGSLVRTYRPDVVVEMLGVNDLTWGGAAPQVVADRVRGFADDARAESPSVELVLGHAPQTWSTGVEEFNGLLDDLAAELDSPQSPVAAAATDVGFARHTHTWDPAHPNAAGEIRIAAAIADALAGLGVGTPYARPLPVVPLGPRVAPVLGVEPGNARLVLSWSGPPGATGQYVWLRDATSGESWRQLPYIVQGDTWTAEELTNGHRYEVRLQPVKGWWAAADDVRSETVSAVPQVPAPSEPVLARAVAVDHGFRVDWEAVKGATRYRVAWARRDGPEGAGALVTAEPATVRALVAGAPYVVSVTAGNAGGWGPVSDGVRVVPVAARPAAPRGLRVTRGPRAIRMSWAAVSGATRYEVQRHRRGAGWSRLLETAAPRARVTDAAARDVRRVRVRAWHQRVAGDVSQPVAVPRRYQP